MDVYQKILLKVYEVSGGKDSEDVDFGEIVKKEGFYPSLPSILEHLSSQSWVTETKRKNIVRITHWGVSAAKKIKTDTTTNVSQTNKKETNQLLSEVRELARIIQEYSTDNSKENFAKIENKLADINAATANIKTNI